MVCPECGASILTITTCNQEREGVLWMVWEYVCENGHRWHEEVKATYSLGPVQPAKIPFTRACQ